MDIIKPTQPADPSTPLSQLQFSDAAFDFVNKIIQWKLEPSVMNPKGIDINVVKGASKTGFGPNEPASIMGFASCFFWSAMRELLTTIR